MADRPLPALSFRQRFSYGVGHVLNDLCASMWFSYLLVFFHKILLFNNQLSGYVMLLGQIADAICTPFIGYESDRTRGFGKYGQRKSWHLLGCVCVLLSFPFVFLQCPGCEHTAEWAQFIYYAPFIVVFQFGWAATQINHLALIPQLTPCESERVGLNALRYMFTVISNILVFIMALVFLGMETEDLGKGDAYVFRNLAFLVVGVGSLFVFIFHLGVKEKACHPPQQDNRSVASINCEEGDEDERAEDEENEETAALDQQNQPLTQYRVHVTVRDWFKEHQFYQVALIYMATRLTCNLSQIYMPMYLTDTLTLPKKYIAIVPLVVFISGFLASFAMRFINKLIGRKITYIAGCLLVIGSCVWFFFLDMWSSWHVVLPAVLLGAGTSIMLVTSLSICADLIGKNTSSGAFVYGAMSFVDKLSNGIGVVMIQNLQPCPDVQVCCEDCVWYYQYTMAFVPSATALLGILGVLSLSCMTIGDLKIFRGIDAPLLHPSRAGTESSTAETEPLLARTDPDSESECYPCSCCCCYPSQAPNGTQHPRGETYGTPGDTMGPGVVIVGGTAGNNNAPRSYGSLNNHQPPPGSSENTSNTNNRDVLVEGGGVSKMNGSVPITGELNTGAVYNDAEGYEGERGRESNPGVGVNYNDNSALTNQQTATPTTPPSSLTYPGTTPPRHGHQAAITPPPSLTYPGTTPPRHGNQAAITPPPSLTYPGMTPPLHGLQAAITPPPSLAKPGIAEGEVSVIRQASPGQLNAGLESLKRREPAGSYEERRGNMHV